MLINIILGCINTGTMTLNIKERQERILDELDRHGACTYENLADRLSVSNMTIRRDIDRLAAEGRVIKILGGAQKGNAPASFYESQVTTRLTNHAAEKRAIAFQALELIEDSQTIFLDGSTTCLELAKLLAIHAKGLTVITNSAFVVLELGRGTDNRIIGIGGQYDPGSLSFVGPTSEDEAKRFFVDQAFFSTKGFLPAEGTFESAVANFRIKQIIAEQCHNVTLLVDHSKFGQRALCKVLDVAQIHRVVTNDRTGDRDKAILRELGKDVHVAVSSDESKSVGRCIS